jgi:hypothetical protein
MSCRIFGQVGKGLFCQHKLQPIPNRKPDKNPEHYRYVDFKDLFHLGFPFFYGGYFLKNNPIVIAPRNLAIWADVRKAKLPIINFFNQSFNRWGGHGLNLYFVIPFLANYDLVFHLGFPFLVG